MPQWFWNILLQSYKIRRVVTSKHYRWFTWLCAHGEHVELIYSPRTPRASAGTLQNTQHCSPRAPARDAETGVACLCSHILHDPHKTGFFGKAYLMGWNSSISDLGKEQQRSMFDRIWWNVMESFYFLFGLKVKVGWSGSVCYLVYEYKQNMEP
jgi:hypothetical protein